MNHTVGRKPSNLVRKYCLFCLEPLTKRTSTREHPIPQWLLRHFGIGGELVSPAGWQEGQSWVRNQHQWLQLVVNDVCARCNSGWLSQLETTAKPLIPPLANRTRTLAELSNDEQVVLARWGAKTAFLIHRTSATPTGIPPEAYVALRHADGKLPVGTCVFAFQDDGERPGPINILQSQQWTMHAPVADALEVHMAMRRTWKISIRIDRLHLLVAYLGDTGLAPVGWHGVHRPLFPTNCRLWINAGFQIDRVTMRQESAMVLFHISLGIALNCSQDQLSRNSPPNLEALHERFFTEFAFPS